MKHSVNDALHSASVAAFSALSKARDLVCPLSVGEQVLMLDRRTKLPRYIVGIVTSVDDGLTTNQGSVAFKVRCRSFATTGAQRAETWRTIFIGPEAPLSDVISVSEYQRKRASQHALTHGAAVDDKDEKVSLLLKAQEVANILGISERLLHQLRKDPRFPLPVDLPQQRRAIRWRRTDVERYIASDHITAKSQFLEANLEAGRRAAAGRKRAQTH